MISWLRALKGYAIPTLRSGSYFLFVLVVELINLEIVMLDDSGELQFETEEQLIEFLKATEESDEVGYLLLDTYQFYKED